jgi:hypothetical protein
VSDTTPKTAEALAAWLTKPVDWYVDGQPITMEQCIRQQCGDLALSYVQAAFWAAAQPQAEPVAAAELLKEYRDACLQWHPAPHQLATRERYTKAYDALVAALAARPPVAQQGAEVVAWGVFAFVDGAWVLQWPVRPRRETAISDSGLYMPGTRLEVRPLYTTPFAAAQPVAQGLTVEQRDAIAWARDEAENEDYFGRKLNAKRLDLLASLGEQVAALSTTHSAQAAEGDSRG